MTKVTMTAKQVRENPNMAGMPAKSTHWKCMLRYQGRRMGVFFSMGPGHDDREPTVQDILECLFCDSHGAEEPFETWVKDLGYDPDSRKALKTYEVIGRQTAKLRRLLGEDFEVYERATLA